MEKEQRAEYQEERADTLAEWLEVHNGRLIYRAPEEDSDTFPLWNYSMWSHGEQWLTLVGNGRADNPAVRQDAPPQADRCGTQACAGGWATLVFPRLLEFDQSGEYGVETVRPTKALLLECETMDEARRLDGAGVRDVMAACFGMVAPFINTQAANEHGEDSPVEPRHVALEIRRRVGERRTLRAAEKRIRIRQEEDDARRDLRAGQDNRRRENEQKADDDIEERCQAIGNEPAWKPPEPVIVEGEEAPISLPWGDPEGQRSEAQ